MFVISNKRLSFSLTHIYILTHWHIGYGVNQSFRRSGFNPSRVILKMQNMVFDASLFNTLHYKVWIKGYRSNPGKGEPPSPFPSLECSSYWNGSLRTTLNYSQPTYNIYICIPSHLLLLSLLLWVRFSPWPIRHGK